LLKLRLEEKYGNVIKGGPGPLSEVKKEMVDLQQMTRRNFRFSGSMARHGLRQESSMEAASLQKSKTASLLAQSNRRLARINGKFTLVVVEIYSMRH
jgi:hypothetical protein